jgi:hypothetical protein
MAGSTALCEHHRPGEIHREDALPQFIRDLGDRAKGIHDPRVADEDVHTTLPDRRRDDIFHVRA